MRVATRTFRYEDRYGGGTVQEGDRVSEGHPLLAEFPGNWRDETLDDELGVRARRVEQLREETTRPATREPLSRAGREEREQERFWSGVDQLLTPTRSSEERREERFWSGALDQLEDLEAARMRDESIEIGKLWYGRIGG